jgi:hypothetical protein
VPAGALAGHLFLFLLAGGLGWRLGANAVRARWIALATLGVLGVQLAALANPERLANALPSPAWIWACDFSPQLALLLLACALRAGSATPEPSADQPQPAPPGRGGQVRRGLLGAVLVGLALYASPLPWVPPGALPSSSWTDLRDPAHPVVRQSADASCAAAAAATLLHVRGIAPLASESTLAELCWTDPREGTGALALWRGLSLAAGPGHRVRYAWPSLDQLAERGPCLIRVGLTDQVSDPKLRRVLEEECGWPPGEAHAVVFWGFDAGREGEDERVALIGDPRIGFERWGITHFRALWQGLTLEVQPASR